MIEEQSAMDRPVAPKGGFTRKRVIGGLCLLAALASAIILYPSVRRWMRSQVSVDISRVRLGKVTRGDLVREVAVDGRVVAAFHPTLFSPSPGIVHVSVRAGDLVEKGQPLGRVESPELESRLQQERSLFHSLKAEWERQRIQSKQARLRNEHLIGQLALELEAAKRAMVRAEKSQSLGVLTAVEFEKTQDDVKILTLRLKGARQNAVLESESLGFELSERKAQLERQRLVVREQERQVEALTICSQVTGLVSRLHVEDREAVAQNAALFTVVDLSTFEVEIAVDENYASEIGPGTPAVLTFKNKEYPGHVRSISPEVEGSRVKSIVAFDKAGPTGLKQNQRLVTRLILETHKNVLKVRRGPFLKSGGGRQAYVVDDQMAVLRPIQVGAQSLSEVQILSGIELGEEIIISDTERFNGARSVLLRK